MKIVKPSLEKKAIRTIVRNDRPAAYLLSSVGDDTFHWPPTKECYRRILALVQRKGEPPSWEELLNDPAIKEKTRNLLANYQKKGCKDKTEARKIANALDSYRKARYMYYNAQETIETLKGESVDVEKLVETNSDNITKARTTGSKDTLFTRIGNNSNSMSVVKEVLRPDNNIYIPTGFKVFDNTNMGMIRGSLVGLAATTGGGKSALAQQLAKNMAMWGAGVCYVPLEMDNKEMMQRRLANISGVPMNKLIDPKNLSDRERSKITKSFKKYKNELKRKGANEDWFVPDEDISIEELLFLLRPYAYDVVVIDYINLLRGVSGDDQPQRLSAAARFAKIFASNNNCLVILCAQLSEEGNVRYSRAIQEHANNLWKWVYDRTAAETHILDIKQGKARNQSPFDFQLVEDFEHMSIRDLSESEKQEAEQIKSDSKNSSKKSKGKSKKQEDNKKSKGFKKQNTNIDDEYLEV